MPEPGAAYQSRTQRTSLSNLIWAPARYYVPRGIVLLPNERFILRPNGGGACQIRGDSFKEDLGTPIARRTFQIALPIVVPWQKSHRLSGSYRLRAQIEAQVGRDSAVVRSRDREVGYPNDGRRGWGLR
jgi:hypothetical protein